MISELCEENESQKETEKNLKKEIEIKNCEIKDLNINVVKKSKEVKKMEEDAFCQEYEIMLLNEV